MFILPGDRKRLITPKVFCGNEFEYHEVKDLGKDRFGTSYLVSYDESIENNPVQQNALLKTLIHSPIDQQYYWKKVQLLAHLKFPAIARIIDFDRDFYVMEKVDGPTLEEYIKSKGRLTLSEAHRLIGNIASALSAIHALGIGHLNLSPSKVIVSRGRAIVMPDFGLARIWNENRELRIALGMTDGYSCDILSKRMVRDEREICEAIDLYSLGAILYIMLTGQTPPQYFEIEKEGFPVQNLLKHHVGRNVIDLIKSVMVPQKGKIGTVSEFMSHLKLENDAYPTPIVYGPPYPSRMCSCSLSAGVLILLVILLIAALSLIIKIV